MQLNIAQTITDYKKLLDEIPALHLVNQLKQTTAFNSPIQYLKYLCLQRVIRNMWYNSGTEINKILHSIFFFQVASPNVQQFEF